MQRKIVGLIECIVQKVISEESKKTFRWMSKKKGFDSITHASNRRNNIGTINQAEAGITMTLKRTISIQLMFIYETISCNSLA